MPGVSSGDWERCARVIYCGQSTQGEAALETLSSLFLMSLLVTQELLCCVLLMHLCSPARADAQNLPGVLLGDHTRCGLAVQSWWGALRRVMVLTNANGRSNGQAFVEFPSPQDAETAMMMDRQMFGNRYVEVRS